MDETNQHTTEKDSDLVTRVCDGSGTVKDTSDSGQGDHLQQKTSGESDLVESSPVIPPTTLNSNGVDSGVKAVEGTIPGDSNFSSSGVAGTDSELPKSNELQSASGEKVIDDQEGEKISGEVTGVFISNEDNSENVEQSKCLDMEENKNETSSSQLGNEQCVSENSLIQDNVANVFSDVAHSDEGCQNRKVNNENICSDVSSLENQNQSNTSLVNMPYEKDICVNDLEINDQCNKDEDGVPVVEGSITENKDSYNNTEEQGHDSPCDPGVSKNVANQTEKECNRNASGSNEFVTPMDVDIKESCFEENPLAEQTSETEEDQQTSNDFNSGYDIKETEEREPQVESSKDDGMCLETESMQEDNIAFSPNNAFANQSEEPDSLKDDAQDCQSEKNELLSTEMVNCNDESQIDINENDKDTEVNNIDTDLCEEMERKDEGDEEMDVDRNGENETVEKDSDKKDDGNNVKDHDNAEESDPEKQIMSVEESEALIQPGGSEEETITGDTSNVGSIDDSRGKDAEICIIPDDVTPRLSIPPNADKSEQKKSEDGDGSEKEEVKILNQTTVEEDAVLVKEEEKNEDESSVKTRPLRVAAKLAGNKIKSLVQSVFEPGSASSSKKGADDNSESSKNEEETNTCVNCGRIKPCNLEVIQNGQTHPLCSTQCYNSYIKTSQPEIVDIVPGTFVRKCGQCHKQVSEDENCLSWETMEFCNEECLGKYQTEMGSKCANCKGSVSSASLGKYCVRFGYDVKQFCTSSCLEEYKKGLKVCSYCQKDISTGTEGFLAPVGDKGHFKDFCTQSCMEKYEQMSNNTPPPTVITECAVCSNSKPVKVEVKLDNKTQPLCSEPCFAAFKFVNNITEGQCDMCKSYFDRLKTLSFSIYYDNSPHTFCCKTCMNVFILAHRKIVPCNWCKVKKYNFDLIRKVSCTGQILMMCSLNCLTLYQVSVNAVSARRLRCDFCMNFAQPKYHLTMSDGTVRNFCGYTCVVSFQNQYPKQTLPTMPGKERLTAPIPTGGPKRILPRRSQVTTSSVPVISSVKSLASPNGPVSGTRVSIPVSDVRVTSISQPITIQPTVSSVQTPMTPQIYQQIITKPPPVKQQKNKSVLCKPYSHTKGVSCRPHPCMKETQTDESLNRKFLIPIPVPIFVPAPMHMFATPFPVAMPFPLPVPVPIFIPTTRNSAKGIFKEIKKIQEKIPTDPFEAELLMMAEMVAGEKKQDPTDSESDDGNDGDDGGDGSFSPQNVDASNTFGEDMLQIALKMATELEEPAVDMESVLTSNTIIPNSQPTVDPNKGLYDDPDQVQVMPMNRGRKRSMRGGRNSSGGSQSKRGRRISGSNVDVPILPPPEPVPPPRIEVEKPDANMCLKYTFGVNAWRHWVMQKNAELEKAALTNRKIKLFKPELLQLTADELNFSLCLFVKEVRKPNGAEYAPDTIYYLCLGIQQYLFENGRIDNIFTDSYYEKFTDCLDEVAKKFAVLYNDSQYIVTRVEEEHLWESKQLGAHSPHVLLSTLMFFNTKHFNLVTVEEHMQLSFSHIMKHWKRNPNAPGVAKVPGSRNVLLRFYPPQSALEANSRKKKVYEQQENEENPLRCPVKLYEFYLSKCPESVKTRNDVFYLLPERSCVPDSPVWYSTMALGKEPLTKMLHRVKMVKEINIALLTC